MIAAADCVRKPGPSTRAAAIVSPSGCAIVSTASRLEPADCPTIVGLDEAVDVARSTVGMA